MIQKRSFILLSGLIPLIYLVILNRYGTAIPAINSPDEISMTNVAQNIATGNGPVLSIPTEIIPHPGEHPHRTYAPLISFLLALSGWGNIWGFELLSLRWFSRILGAINLILVIGLARRWGISQKMALLTAFWISMDILYQMIGNMVRPEMFSLFWIILGLLAFTESDEQRKNSWLLTSGVCFAIAIFAHFLQAFYILVWLSLVVLWKRRWKGLVISLFPSLIAVLFWMSFALQDWEWFLTYSYLMIRDKTPGDWRAFIVQISGIPLVLDILGIYPSNSPIWLAVVTTLTWARIRKHVLIPIWVVGIFPIAYVVGHMNPHPWYAGWFTLFGYLGLAIFLDRFVVHQTERIVRFLPVLAILWSAYQLVQVSRCWITAPDIHQAHQQFFNELNCRASSRWLILDTKHSRSLLRSCSRPS